MTIIDLSHTLEPGMPVLASNENPAIERIAGIGADGYRETRLSICSHNGTHVDAPAHLLDEGLFLEQLPLDRFFGPALLLDVSDHRQPLITPDRLQPHEAAIHRAEFVIFRTGWSRVWGQEKYYQNFPVLTQPAAQWLLGFNLKGLGIDAFSFDPYDAAPYPVHRLLLGGGLILVENLNNLESIPTSRFQFSCLPLPYGQADGSPVRAVALVE